jgi:hypothetical protein
MACDATATALSWELARTPSSEARSLADRSAAGAKCRYGSTTDRRDFGRAAPSAFGSGKKDQAPMAMTFRLCGSPRLAGMP